LILESSQREAGCLATSVKLRLLDPLQVEHWDELVRTHPDATAFHSQGWARVLAETYGYIPMYLAAADSRRLWGLLPLFEVRSWLTGTRGVSLPFTDQCAPLLSPSFDFKMLFETARNIGMDRKWKSLELRGGNSDFAPPSRSYYQHDLDLTLSESSLFEGCDPAMRRAIRKAQRASVTVESSKGTEGIEAYYRLHQCTRQKHGLPPQSLEFFRNIQRFVIEPGHGIAVLGRLQGVPVAGAIYLHFGAHSVYKFGASDPTRQDLRASNLVMWTGLIQMKELGAKVLSFGRTSFHQDGLRRFKRSFGASETPLHYIKYDFAASSFTLTEADRAAGGVHTLLFRLCPKRLSRLIGTVLYPHVG